MKNKNLILATLIMTLSVIVSVSTITSIHSQRPDPILTEMLEYEDKIIDKKNTKINTTEHVPKFFAIQHAQSGSIVQIFDKMAYSLKLNDVSDKTILFSDKPDRIVKSASTSDFIGNWSIGEDSFAKNPPNAVLVIDEQEQQNVAIVELFDPIYNSNTNMLEYNMHIDGTESIELHGEFGKFTLLIDSTDANGVDYNYISEPE